MPANEGPPATDKHGNPLSAYPDPTEHGRLLGFNFAGNAVYATTQSVTLATLDTSGDLRVPPRERWLSGEFPLDEVGLTPGDYVLYAADEGGQWRALTEAAGESVSERGVDPDEVVRNAPAEGSPDDTVAALADDDPERAAAASDDLRRLVVDRPEAFLDHLDTILDGLRERFHGEGELDIDPEGGGAGTADPAAPEQGMLLRNAAFAVARIVRASPDFGFESLDRLLACFDENRDAAADVHHELLLDAVDVLGRQRTEQVAEALADRLGRADDPSTVSRARLLNAVYHLEQRYATRTHPLLEDGTLRAAVDRIAEGSDPTLAEAAAAVRTVHDFHS